MKRNRSPSSINALPFILFMLSEISCFEERSHPHLLVTFERVSSENYGALKYKEVFSKRVISQLQQTQPLSLEAGGGADNLKYDKNILPQNKLTNSPLGPGTGDNMDSHGINSDTNKIEQSDEAGEKREKFPSKLIEPPVKIIKNVADKRNSFVGSNDNEAGTSAVKFQQSDLTFSSFALLAISIIAFILYL